MRMAMVMIMATVMVSVAVLLMMPRVSMLAVLLVRVTAIAIMVRRVLMGSLCITILTSAPPFAIRLAFLSRAMSAQWLLVSAGLLFE